MNLRWGIIGCGNVAETKGGPALYGVEGSELVAVMSRSAEKGADFAQRHGARRHYTSVADLLSDDEVDAVYVATPPHLHAEQTVLAAEAGKHVLCEKPMALTVAECETMVAACRDAGVELWIAYYRRCWPPIVLMKELLERGTIGQPTMARVTLTGMYGPPGDGTIPWRLQPEVSGGGGLMDVGSHRLDLLVHLLGEVRDVSAFVDTISSDLAVDDSASLLLKFAGGAQAVVSCHWNVADAVDELEVGGTKGRLMATNVGTGDLLIRAGGESES
ncbi:MAG TPA: Gfo/Idh/MocA family oxidoreductase, partial [Armatimonadota bacterium]|nr:Gfo/Idh/MocA family oxidoreductase [Armatimonadota bacterium]